MIYETLHRKLKIEQHEPRKTKYKRKTGGEPRCPEIVNNSYSTCDIRIIINGIFKNKELYYFMLNARSIAKGMTHERYNYTLRTTRQINRDDELKI